jgi:hypothetical protein
MSAERIRPAETGHRQTTRSVTATAPELIAATTGHTQSTQAKDTLNLTGLLERLGHTGNAIISSKVAGGGFRNWEIPVEGAAAHVGNYPPDTNVYFQVNPTRDGAGRGAAQDITRLAALWLDLDVKHGGMPTMAEAEKVIDTVSGILGTRPVVIIHSGHGLQPLWPIDPHDPGADLTAGDNRSQAAELLKRFGELARRVASAYGGGIDSVFDLPRLLRAPGSINSKPGMPPVPARAVPDNGYPLAIAQVQESLGAHQPPVPTPTSSPAASSSPHAATADEDGQIERYVAAAVQGITNELKASAAWPIGHSDEDGRGWDKLQADAAYRLGEFAKATWAPLTLSDAWKEFSNAAPTDPAWTAAKVRAKFDYQTNRASPAKRPAPRTRATHHGLAFPGLGVTPAVLSPGTGKEVARFAAGGTVAEVIEISQTEIDGQAVDDESHSYLSTAVSAADLMATDFPPIRYVVEDLIPEGLTMVVAPPKIGKSWLVLGLGLAVSNGSLALGCIRTEARPVIYFALEDGHRRLKSRLTSLGAVKPSPDLTFITTVARGDIPHAISEYLDVHRDKAPVVIIDTLGKAQSPALPGETTYDRDYRVVGNLKGLADAHPGSSIILVHHTRKASGSDFVDAVSGTQGIAGAADTVLLLRRERGENIATLHATSRDTQEGEYAVALDASGRWTLAGDSLEAAANAEQTAKVTGGLSDRMTDVIAAVGRHPEGITPRNLKSLLRDIPPEAVDVYLGRAYAAGRLRRLTRGKYAPLPQPFLNPAPE